MENALQIKINSLKSNEGETILSNINFDVKKGDFIALCGEAASGKTALLHTIVGASEKFNGCCLDGSVSINGEDVSSIPLNKINKVLGFVMQEPQNQILLRDIDEEISFGAANLNLTTEEILSITKKMKNKLNLDNLNATTDQLSGGQAQRVVLGSVLAMGCPILLLDQPSAELDEKAAKEFYALLDNIRKERSLSIIIVPDRMDYVTEYVNRILFLEKGTLKAEIKPFEYESKLSVNKNKAADLPKSQKNILSINNLSYKYKNGNIGVKNINIEINEGEFAVIQGPNGCGKSTLLKLTEGLLEPDYGEIYLFGKRADKKSFPQIRKKIGFIFQNPDNQIFLNSVYDELVFTLKKRKLDDALIKEKAEHMLTFLRLNAKRDDHPQTLSRSQRQMLAIGSVLINEPDLIIADEPTCGLDDNQSIFIMDKLFFAAKEGKTVIIVSHNSALTNMYATKIIHMNRHEIKIIDKAVI